MNKLKSKTWNSNFYTEIMKLQDQSGRWLEYIDHDYAVASYFEKGIGSRVAARLAFEESF